MTNPFRYRALILMGVMTFLVLAIVAVNLAQQTAPQIDIIVHNTAPAAPVSVMVRGFAPGERVGLTLHSPGSRGFFELGEFVVEADGTFDAQVVLPGDWVDSTASVEQDLILRATSLDRTTIASISLTQNLPRSS